MKLENPFALDLRSLALVRVLLGVLILADLAVRSTHIGVWLTDAGVLPLAHLVPQTSAWRFSLYFLSGDLWWAWTLTTVQGIAAFALLIGYRTRIATLVLLVLLISLHNRNPLILQGGDNLLLLLVFWSLFVPMAARWSLDAALSRKPLAEHTYASIGTAGLLLQVMAVYFFSALLKSGPEWTEDGTAIYYALHLDQFATGLAPWLRDALWLSEPLTHYVWWLELLGPILIFSPVANTWFRTVGVAAFVSLELGFILNLNLGLFPYISIASILLFVPSAFWDKWQARLHARKPTIGIYFDQDCGFCEKSCHIFRTIYVLPTATIQPAQSHPTANQLLTEHYSWVVIVNGQPHLRSGAMAALLQQSPLLFWSAPIMRALGKPADVLYDWVAEHRGQFGTLFAVLFPWRQMQMRPGRVMNGVAAVFVVMLGWWNISTVSALPFPTIAANAKDTLRLDQIWNMFAPAPRKDDGWFVVPGALEDGSVIDVRAQSAPSFEKPERFAEHFENYRWRKFLNRLWLRSYAGHRLPYGQWLCREANEAREVGARLLAWDLYYVEERTPPPGAQGTVRRHRIWRHRCFEAGTDAAQAQLDGLERQ